MIDLSDINPVPYADPWNISLLERFKKLQIGKKRIAYFYEKADNSTFRYRIYNMTQAINLSQEAISAAYFFLDDAAYFDDIAEKADMLVICRARYNHEVNQLIHQFKKRGKKVLFDIDDLVFNTDHTHLVISTLDADIHNPHTWDFWFAYISRMGQTLKLCDGAITTNNYLAEQIKSFINIPVSVIPNFINKEQLEFSELIFEKKKKVKSAKNGLIHMGYFSGSPSHNKDFNLVSSSLMTLFDFHPKLRLVLVGYIDIPEELNQFKDRVEKYPYQDFITLQKLIGSVEFNLMPLQNNLFTNCKSELKYFEAAIVGTQSIASPSFTYERAIDHTKNGYLAQTHQWESMINLALDNIANYHTMAEFSYESSKKNYAWYNQLDCIFNALEV